MKKSVLIVMCVAAFLTIIGTIGAIFLFQETIYVKLNGNDVIEVPVLESYTDAGFTILRNNQELDKNKYEYQEDNQVNALVIGTYDVKYHITYKNKSYDLKRRVSVVDKVAPEIIVNVDTVEQDYCTKKIKTKLEYTAFDNYDGDLTENILSTLQEDKMVLQVEDSSGNVTTKEIAIQYGEKPNNKFTLNGNSKVYVVLNGVYQEAGASYTDGCGNKLNADIKITGEVDTTKVGDYKITYTLNNQTLTRIVSVYEKSESVNASKVIYLTFDDGPGYYTKSILNTLDKYHVKATFFVTNQFPSYLSLLTEEYQKGHTVALHTYSHQYSIYSSVDTYLDDFNKMNEIIKTYTGSYTKLFRFPGGSSNTVSMNYKRGIMSELAQRMTKDGYVYFDWNVSSTDASGSNSTKIYNSVVNGVNSCNQCVVLMHDIKGTTANALDSILNTLTNKGYTFATLNESSPTAHHGINN